MANDDPKGRGRYKNQQKQSRIYLIETKHFAFTSNPKIYVSNFLFLARLKNVFMKSKTHICPFFGGISTVRCCLAKKHSAATVKNLLSYLSVESYLFFRLHRAQKHRRGWFSIQFGTWTHRQKTKYDTIRCELSWDTYD